MGYYPGVHSHQGHRPISLSLVAWGNSCFWNLTFATLTEKNNNVFLFTSLLFLLRFNTISHNWLGTLKQRTTRTRTISTRACDPVDIHRQRQHSSVGSFYSSNENFKVWNFFTYIWNLKIILERKVIFTWKLASNLLKPKQQRPFSNQ